MEDLVIKIFKCISRRSAILMMALTSINFALALAAFGMFAFSTEGADIYIMLYFIGSLLAFGWALTVMFMLEDCRKVGTNGDSPVGSQSHFVHNYFAGEYKHSRSRRIWACILIVFLIFQILVYLVPAIMVDEFTAGAVGRITGVLIPLSVLALIIVRLLAEDITIRYQLGLLENGDFTYTQVMIADRYYSFAKRKRYSFDYRVSKYIVVEDSQGNRGRFKVNNYKMESSVYAKNVYVIMPNRKLGMFEEPLLYFSNGSFEEAEEQYYDDNFKFV